jgi:hypothetical protein
MPETIADTLMKRGEGMTVDEIVLMLRPAEKRANDTAFAPKPNYTRGDKR